MILVCSVFILPLKFVSIQVGPFLKIRQSGCSCVLVRIEISGTFTLLLHLRFSLSPPFFNTSCNGDGWGRIRTNKTTRYGGSESITKGTTHHKSYQSSGKGINLVIISIISRFFQFPLFPLL